MSGQRQWEWRARRLLEHMLQESSGLVDSWDEQEYDLHQGQATDCNALAADVATLVAEYCHLEPTGCEEYRRDIPDSLDRLKEAYKAAAEKADRLGQQVRDAYRPIIRAAVNEVVEGELTIAQVKTVIFSCPDCVGRAFGFDYARQSGLDI